MKQINMFGAPEPTTDKKYTGKIEAPIYEPKNKKPELIELRDKAKLNRLLREINASNVTEEEKKFLIEAAHRHVVFNYEKVADYYAHASKEMQTMMEKSALVIIDFEDAIQLGFVQLCDDIRTQYLEEYGE